MQSRCVPLLAPVLALAVACASNHEAMPDVAVDAASADAPADATPSVDAPAEASVPDAQVDAAPLPEWPVGDGALAPVSGQAFVFGPSGDASLQGATVSVAEAPAYSTTVAADGTFALQVPSGAPLSFVLEQAGFHPNQSATLPIEPAGVTMLGFQAPTDSVFGLLATVARVRLDPTRCQIATTVSRAGTAPYGGSGLGEPGVVVSIDPPLPAGASGPIYFQYLDASSIVPDPTLTATSIDGGVIFANLPPGEYTLTATKPGEVFSPVAIRCRPNTLANAAPPHGLQQL